MRSRSLVVALAALGGGGCGAEQASSLPPPSDCLPPNRLVAERCVAPGVQDDGCPAGTLGRNADDLYGDGVIVVSDGASGSAAVTASRIEASARAGLSNFGATVALGASALACNAVDVHGATYLEQQFHLHDLGDNACGCPEPVSACKAQSAGLEPPEPIGESPQ